MTTDDNADAQPVIPQEDPWQDVPESYEMRGTGTPDGDLNWVRVRLYDADLVDQARVAVHAQHAQEIARLKEELESTPYGKMRRTLTLRAEAAQAQIVTLQKQFKAHTEAVGTFLTELHAVMVDPCAEGITTVADMKALLLAAAIRDRDAADEAQGEITRLSAQLHAKDLEIERLTEQLIRMEGLFRLEYDEADKLRRKLADEQLLRRNAEAKFADLQRQMSARIPS